MDDREKDLEETIATLQDVTNSQARKLRFMLFRLREASQFEIIGEYMWRCLNGQDFEGF